MPELFVTNFSRNITGVTTTAAAVTRHQISQFDLALVGQPLPDTQLSGAPLTYPAALRALRKTPPGRPFAIWHVRRNTEIRAALLARDLLRLPVRIVFTSAAIRRHSALPRWLISRVDAVIATSEAAAALVPYSRAIVPHGVETDRFTPAKDRMAAWSATGYPGRVGLATIGRIRPEKGTDRFVDTMLHLLPRHPSLTALVIGRAARSDRNFLERLKRKTRDAGLADRLIFTGELPPRDMPRLLSALSAVVQLPRYEGYGMVPLEGMACGVPFVATDQGAYARFAAHSRGGLIVPAIDPQVTAKTIDDLLSHPDRHAQMAHDARDAACTRFSTAQEASAIAAVYDTLWTEGLPQL